MVESILSGLASFDEATVLPWLTAIVSNAIVASLIAMLAWMGSRLYRRPSLWHAVWVLAMIKLFLPPMWSIPTTLFSDRLPALAPGIISTAGSPVAEAGINAIVVASPTLDSDASALAATNTTQHPETIEGRRLSLPHTSWVFVLSALWVIGSLIVLAASAFRIVRFHVLVRRSARADAATDALLNTMASSFCKSSKRPRVRLVDQIVPPLLWPIGRTPTIVLPSLWWQTTTHDERRTVLMHELIHWRRGDHWIRLLQWTAGNVFWWHPLVWIARGEVHRLEEQCCDAEVMHRLPGAGRSYTSALLSASQWLDDTAEANMPRFQPSLFAMPMSHLNQFESFHRRIEMLPRLCYRPWTRRRLVAVLLSAAMPLAIGVSVGAQPPAAPETQAKSASEDANQAKLVGKINDLEGKPIADAKVRIVIPSAQLRFAVDPSEHREIWGKTDATGSYSIDIGGIEKETTASIDIMHRGHRRLVGTLMSGGDPNEVTLSPGGLSEFNANLPESLYFAGQVVDETGQPIEGVSVFSSICSEKSCAGVEQSTTDREGRFAVYSYEAAFLKDHPKWGKQTAAISFQHDRYIDADLEKLESTELSKRDDLRVVMRAGHSIAGTVNDIDGAPASDIVISISQADPYQRKALRTDETGRFRFDGVNGGKTTLRVVDVARNRKSIEEFTVDANNTEMIVALKPVDSPIATTHQVLGMTLTDVTTTMNEAYDLRSEKTQGVMIVDPGNSFEDLAIGELRPGYVFWMVGNDRVSDLRSMVSRLIHEAKSPTIPPGSEGNTSAWTVENGGAKVRVVYSFSSEEGRGTNTQYMQLMPQDIAELEMLLESFKTDEKN